MKLKLAATSGKSATIHGTVYGQDSGGDRVDSSFTLVGQFFSGQTVEYDRVIVDPMEKVSVMKDIIVTLY